MRRVVWPACTRVLNGGDGMQGIKDISVQSSVSLQHLPYNAELETALPKELQSRLAFAKQKVAEIAAATKATASSGVSLTAALPPVSKFHGPLMCLSARRHEKHDFLFTC